VTAVVVIISDLELSLILLGMMGLIGLLLAWVIDLRHRLEHVERQHNYDRRWWDK
jgi:uncharacterized membrane protein YqjE